MNRPHTKRTIVITGATKGLGYAMAEEFIRRGHTVCGCGRSERIVRELKSRHAAPHRFDAVDVTSDPAVAQWAHDVIATHGPPDLLLNNAGLANQRAPLWDVPADEFSQVVDINIKGVYHVIRHFVPAMIARGEGVVVNFSSGWGRSTSPEVAPYCTTKWAIEGMTQALAQELPTGLATVAYSPGVIDTDMLRVCFGDAAAHHEKPDTWAQKSVPVLLSLGAQDNGRSI